MASCSQCNQSIPDESKFCPFCGAKYDSTISQKQSAETKPPNQENKSNPVNQVKAGEVLGSKKPKYIIAGWVKASLWGLVIAFVCWANHKSPNSSNSTTAYSSSPNTDNFVHDGLYHCSDYDTNQANQLKPGESESQAIENDRIVLNSHLNEVNSLYAEMNAMGVTADSSQDLIDSYNEKVNDYNTKKASYDIELQAFNSRVDAYNASKEAYNNYLDAHCRK